MYYYQQGATGFAFVSLALALPGNSAAAESGADQTCCAPVRAVGRAIEVDRGVTRASAGSTGDTVTADAAAKCVSRC